MRIFRIKSSADVKDYYRMYARDNGYLFVSEDKNLYASTSYFCLNDNGKYNLMWDKDWEDWEELHEDSLDKEQKKLILKYILAAE